MTFSSLWRHALIILLLWPLSAFALPEYDFVVSDIRIRGLERVALGSIFRILPIQPGDRIDRERVQYTARRLFATNQFDDIQFERTGTVLYIILEERPWIQSILVTGNKAISEDALLEGLADAGLKEGEVFRRATVEAIQQELLRQYVGQGRYTASIEVNTDPRPKNQVALSIEIDEGRPARIKRINVIGNHALSNKEILSKFQLSDGGFFTFLTGSNKYSREKLSGDLEALRSRYLNLGYANFRLNSVEVSIDDQQGGVYLSISLTEGPVHRIGEIKFSGNPPLEEEELKRLLAFKTGDIYSQSRIVLTEEIITRRLNNLGYIFVKAGVVPSRESLNAAEDVERDDEPPAVDLTVYIDTGKQTYVRRIYFVGNEQTLDSVLRREMRQAEGAAASAAALERSRLRLERSGYFRTVDMETIPVAGTDDQIDVEFEVEEELSGSLTFNLGYSEASGTFYNINLDQKNFLGSGKQLSISAQRSSFSRSLGFSFAEPYFTLDGLSMGFTFSLQELDYANINIAGYFTDSVSANLTLGALLNDQQRIQFTFGVEDTDISQGVATFNLIDELVQNQSMYQIFKMGVNWSHITLNRGLFPTDGVSHNVAFELGVGDGFDYILANWRARFYVPLGGKTTFVWRQRIGVLNVFDSGTVPPFFKFFRVGGLSTIRGFEFSSLGPWAWGGVCANQPAPSEGSTTAVTVLCDTEEGEEYVRLEPGTAGFTLDTIGSNILFVGSLELVVPTPFVPDARSVRTTLFWDYGDAYSTDCDPRLYVVERCSTLFSGNLEFSWSTGIALVWITGFGPMNFVLSYTPDQNPWDRTERFEFSLGNYF